VEKTDNDSLWNGNEENGNVRSECEEDKGWHNYHSHTYMTIGPTYTAQSINSWQGDIFFNLPAQQNWISFPFNHFSNKCNSKFHVASIPHLSSWNGSTPHKIHLATYFVLYFTVW
jgi:hypothetical protein